MSDTPGGPRTPAFPDRTVTQPMQALPAERRSGPEGPRRVLRERAKARWPMVLLTLVSIIQALALETLWSELVERPTPAGGLAGAIAGLQSLAVLLVIVLVWVFFAQLVMRFVWVPGLRDTLAPFLIGLLEFVLADRIGAPRPGIWIALLSLGFLGAHFLVRHVFARAAAEADNAGFLRADAVGPWRRYGITLGSAALLLLLAGGVELAAAPIVTLPAFALVVVLLLMQLWLQRVYWRASVLR